MLSRLWARITGADKGKTYPDQQASMLGRVGDFVIVYPYGMYCDLPDDVLAKEIGDGILLPMTIIRPDDVERGEPVWFHPVTNTRIIARNDGILDIETGEGGTAPVNIKCTQANITASESATIDTPQGRFTGDLQVDGALNATGNLTTESNLGVDGSASVIGTLEASDVTATTADVTLSTHLHPGTNQPPTPGT